MKEKIINFIDEHFIWGWVIWVAVLTMPLLLLGKFLENFLGWPIPLQVYFLISGTSYPILAIVVIEVVKKELPY